MVAQRRDGSTNVCHVMMPRADQSVMTSESDHEGARDGKNRFGVWAMKATWQPATGGRSAKGVTGWSGLRLALALSVLLLLLPILPATTTSASAAITVTSNADAGPNTLRQAVADIDPGGTITFAPGLGPITLASGLDITKAMTITGNGPDNTIIQGGPDPLPPGNNNPRWLFTVQAASGTVAFAALTVRNYYGGIVAESLAAVTNVTFSGFSYVGFWNVASIAGQVTVTNSTFTGNHYGVDQKPGGLHAVGAALSISNTTFSGNDYGFGIFVESEQPSSATVTNSTFTGNGTGLVNAPTGPHPLTVTNSTFSGNTIVGYMNEAEGGAPNQGPAPATITSSIVAGNATNCQITAGTVTDGGHNLEYGTGAPASSCPFTTSAVHADPQLGPLQDNGGRSQTRALSPTSPAINAGGAIGTDCPATDQRGGTRAAQCDIGAFELVKLPSATTLASGANPSVVGQAVTFTATVTIPLGGTPTGTVTFKDNGSDIPGCVGRSIGSGQATCTTSALSAGDRTITAIYSGDTNFATSTSPALVQHVIPLATKFVVSGYPSPTTAGESHGVTVTATDDNGNVATTYSGPVTVTTTDPQATIQAAHTLTNGVGTFTVTFRSGGTQTITATGPAPSGSGTITGIQSGILVIATPTSKDACKDGGWQQLTDANGQLFKNQGQCVGYSNHQ